MESPDVELVRKIFDAFEQRDIDALIDLADPEVEFRPVTADIAAGGQPYVGVEGVRRYFADLDRTWEELRPVPQEFREVEGGVLALGRIYARRVDGVLVDSPAGWLWRLERGRVVSGRIFGSREEALAAAGEQEG